MTAIKFCGLTNVADARRISRLGADMIGVIVNVDVDTPREISRSKASEIFGALPDNVEKVVVSMLRGPEDGKNILRNLSADYLQIHNYMNPEELNKIRKKTKKDIIAVLSIPHGKKEEKEILNKAKILSRSANFLLLDTASSRGGGTGKTHDWNLSRKIKKDVGIPVILAGGLDPNNVEKALNKVEPFAIDISSGVEKRPGKKDLSKVKKILERVN